MKVDLTAVAKAVGYKAAISVSSKEELEKELSTLNSQLSTIGSPILLEVRVRKGNRKNLGRPTTTPIENKEALMEYLKG